jgi:hypothetical protein
MSFSQAVWTQRDGLLVMAIGDVTAAVMRKGNVSPAIVGDGSLEGALAALNTYLETERD